MLEEILNIFWEKHLKPFPITSHELRVAMQAVGIDWQPKTLSFELKKQTKFQAKKVLLGSGRDGRVKGWIISMATGEVGDPNNRITMATGEVGDPNNRITMATGEPSNKLLETFLSIEQAGLDFRKQIPRALAILHPDRKFEIRCLGAIRGTRKQADGVFDDLAAAAKYIQAANGKYKGVYWTLNPTTREVTNRIDDSTNTTTDAQIERRTWLLIDIEGARPEAKTTNATREEVAAAVGLAETIRATVASARPLVLCSGNGCHLLYRIDLPNDPDAKALVSQALKGLAAHYNTDHATIDTTVSNASRISKMPGTLTRKGEHTEDRPQRHSYVLDWEQVGTLDSAQLQLWASWAPAKPSPTPKQSVAPDTRPAGRRGPLSNAERAALWLERRDPAVDGQHGHDWTYQTACAVFVDFDLSQGEALQALSTWNVRCLPPWDEDELRGFVERAEKYATGVRGQKADVKPEKWTENDSPKDEKLLTYFWNDWGNSRAIVFLYGDRLRWCTTAAKWYCWVGTHWQQDDKSKALQWANKTALARLQSAELIEDEDERKKAKSYFKGCLSTKSRNAALEQFKSWEPCLVVAHEFDRDKWLLNFENGTLDLRTCILQRHHQDDLITKLVKVKYDPMATCPKWDAFLMQMMNGDQEMISYLQRAIGYSLTGDTREQCLFLCTGGGKNGKSVFLEVLGKILAEFSVQSPASTFQETQGEKIPNDIARLKGARFVRCVETDEELVFNEGLIKQMTGSDTLTARFLRAEWFEFRPEFKLWFATNHKPRVKGTDDGVWRRMRVIPWSVKVADRDVDLMLESKLMEEAAGIIAWAVRGCQEWQKSGLREPDLVIKETKEYRLEMDSIAQWIEECCDTGPLLQESNALLWKYYRNWAGPKGLNFGNEISFGRRLSLKGFKPVHIDNRTRGRQGLRIDLRVKKSEDLELPSGMREPEFREMIDGFNL